MAHKIKPVLKDETPEEAEELIQKMLSKFDMDASKCRIEMIKRAQFAQAAMSYYLYEGTLTQERYFEYFNQLLSGMKKAIKSCECMKKK